MMHQWDLMGIFRRLANVVPDDSESWRVMIGEVIEGMKGAV